MIVKSGHEIRAVIRSERKRQGLTTRELAARSGIHIATLNSLLYKADLRPGLRILLPVLHALGLEMVIVRKKQ